MKYIERKTIDKEKIEYLSQETGFDELIIKLLCMRNIDTVSAINLHMRSGFDKLNSPLELSNISIAKDIITQTIDSQSPILIYGDYDCDGIGAIAILYLTLKHLNADVYYYIPQRHDEGYGLNIESIKRLNNKYHPKLVITVDCGITSVAEVEYLKLLGIQTIITDHHEPGQVLPDAVIINPMLDGNKNPLCGAGVSLKLAEILTSREYIYEFVDICAISTLADVVPLIGDNRIIVKEGLKMLSKSKCREGLKKLMLIAGLKKGQNVTAEDIAYKIAPRLNASGRLSNAEKSLRLLVSEDITEINMLVEELENENKKRQDIFSEVIKDALFQLEEYDFSRNLIIILQSDKWEEGVIGIAAAKLVEQFRRPAILFTNKDGTLKGSARSISGINIYEVIDSCREMLINFGGHPMAAGLSIEKKDFFKFSAAANAHIKEHIPKSSFEKKIVYDERVCIKDLDNAIIEDIIELEPFGSNNPKPVFVCQDYQMDFKPIGKHPHVLCKRSNCQLIAFNRRHMLPLLVSPTPKTFSYTINREIFRNKEFIKCNVLEIASPYVNLDEHILFAKYLETFTYVGELAETRKRLPDSDYGFGVLYVSFTSQTYNDFPEEGYEKIVFDARIMNPYNAIVLSPEKGFVYTYYNKIILLEKPSKSFLNHVGLNFSGIIEDVSTDYPKFDITYELSVELLREDFLFFRKSLQNMHLIDIVSVYNKSKMLGYKRNFIDFCISYYIFSELNLITINSNGNIILNNYKVEIETSEIYQWLNTSKDR